MILVIAECTGKRYNADYSYQENALVAAMLAFNPGPLV